MARGKGRGGYRAPANPAPASGPGALSQRTDGGPSPDYVGLGYGENKAVNQQASSAPMAGRGGGGGQPAPQGQPARRPVGPEGIFGPTDRPYEPMTSGVDWGPGAPAPVVPQFNEDVNYVVRAIVAENPHLADYLLGLADA